MNIRCKQPRQGGAATEAAIFLPLILLIISATVELSSAIYLKETLTIAAFEGARVAVTRDSDDARVRSRVDQVLAERSINLDEATLVQTVSISPASDEAELMEPIEVRVTAPTSGNITLPFRFLQFMTPGEMSATVVMRKEFTLEAEEESTE